MRRILVWTLILGIAAIVYWGLKNSEGIQASKSSGMSLPAGQSVVSLSAVKNPKDMRQALSDAYRLKPDQRCLIAVREIHHFMTGEPLAQTEVYYKDGWKVNYAGQSVGQLPELPGYEDCDALLSGWVKKLQQKTPIQLSAGDANLSYSVRRQVNAFFIPDLIALLGEIDAQWAQGKRDAVLLQGAAQAYVLLSLQMLNRTGIGDGIEAKAWALVAMAKNLTDLPVMREEALLALLLDYGKHAEALAESLPPEDAVHLYVKRSDGDLEKLVQGADASLEARYFWLLRLAALEQGPAWYEWMQRHFMAPAAGMSVIRAGLELNQFNTNRAILHILPSTLLGSLSPKTDEVLVALDMFRKAFTITGQEQLKGMVQQIMSMAAGKLADRFEQAISAKAAQSAGPFWSEWDYRSYFESYFYSGLYMQGNFYLYSLASEEAARGFLKRLGGKSDAAKQFERWYGHLTQADLKEGDARDLDADLQELYLLGTNPMLKTYEALNSRLNYGDPRALVSVRSLIKGMDARPKNCAEIGRIAYLTLNDLPFTEKMFGNVLRRSTGPRHAYAQEVYAKMTADLPLLWSIVSNSSYSVEIRVRALKSLDGLKEPADRIDAGFARVVADMPDEWEPRDTYIRWLEERKQYAKALDVLEDWFRRGVKSYSMQDVLAQTAIARMHYHEGRYEEALKNIEPVIDSYQAGAMERAARIYNKLGKLKEAEELFLKTRERYPTLLRTVLLYSEFLWEHKRYADAGAAFAGFRGHLSDSDWQFTVGESFAGFFKDRPVDEGVAAFGALLKAGIEQGPLSLMTRPVSRVASPELAYRMHTTLKFTRDIEVLMGKMAEYGFLKQWKGSEEALKMLKPAVPRDRLTFASMLYFRDEHYDLLWQMIPSDTTDPHMNMVWLIRAAAYNLDPAGLAPYRQELLDYFKPSIHEKYHVLGQYLLGLRSEQDLWPLMVNDKERCEFAYYLGLKAQGEGRMEDASDWYRVSVETGLTNNGEYRWAHDTLYKWAGTGKSLALIGQERAVKTAKN